MVRRGGASTGSKGAADVLAFAQGLRDLAAEAEQFYGDVVERRLKALRTRNRETRFRNHIQALADGLRDRQTEFRRLVRENGTGGESLSSTVLRDLETKGFAEYLDTLANAVQLLASRARGGISKADRVNMQEEIRAVVRMLAGLNAIADEIERRVKAIRNEEQQESLNQPPLPQSIEDALRRSESAARAFIEKLASQPVDFEKHAIDSTLRWLSAAEAERKRLMGAADAFAAVLTKFTDEHLEEAEQAGHTEARKLIAEILQVVKTVRARRNISQQLLQSVIQAFQATLSLDDDALEAAGQLLYMLNELETRLAEAGIVVTRQQERAEQHARLRQPPKKPLPEWTELDREGHDELRLLVVAFVRLLDEQPNGMFTKVRLERQLQNLRPRGTDWASWLDRKLKKAMGLGIVLQPEPDKNKRVPHLFGFSIAALRKYAAAARAFR